MQHQVPRRPAASPGKPPGLTFELAEMVRGTTDDLPL